MIPEEMRPSYATEHTLTVVAGPHADESILTEEGLRAFFGTGWKVHSFCCFLIYTFVFLVRVLLAQEELLLTLRGTCRGVLYRSAHQATEWASDSKVRSWIGRGKTEGWEGVIRVTCSIMAMRMVLSISYVPLHPFLPVPFPLRSFYSLKRNRLHTCPERRHTSPPNCGRTFNGRIRLRRDSDDWRLMEIGTVEARRCGQV